MTPTEIQALNEMLPAIDRSTTEWAEPTGPLRPELAPAMALVNFLVSPARSINGLSARVKLSIWVFAVDELFERPHISFGALDRVITDCVQVAAEPFVRSRGSVGKTPYGVALGGALDDLVQCPGWAAIQPIWVALLIRLLDGMAYEYFLTSRFRKNAEAQAKPDLDEYLFHTRHTLSAPLVWSTSLADIADVDRDAIAQVLAILEKCGTVLRLANDLATPASEYQSGYMNAVRIQGWAHATEATAGSANGLQLGKMKVEAMLKSEYRSLKALVQRLGDSQPLAAGFLRGTDFLLTFCKERDVREWASGLASLARSSEPDSSLPEWCK